MKIKSYSKQNQIIFIVEIPIVENESYEYFHLYPIPTRFKDSFVAIIPSSKYLLSNGKNYALTNTKCQEITSEEFICEETHATKIGNSPCEVQLLKYFDVTNCKPRKVKISEVKVQKLEKNHWIIVTPSYTAAIQKCGKEESNIPLNGSYLLELNNECTVTVKNKTIKTFQNTNNKFQIIQLPNIQLFTDLQMNEEVNFEPLKIDSVNLDNLMNIYSALDNQRLDIAKINDKPIYFHKISFYTILLYICIVLVIIYIGYRRYWKSTLKKTERKPEKEIEMEQRTLPSIIR